MAFGPKSKHLAVGRVTHLGDVDAENVHQTTVEYGVEYPLPENFEVEKLVVKA
jgi:hypothetical protein